MTFLVCICAPALGAVPGIGGWNSALCICLTVQSSAISILSCYPRNLTGTNCREAQVHRHSPDPVVPRPQLTYDQIGLLGYRVTDADHIRGLEMIVCLSEQPVHERNRFWGCQKIFFQVT